MLSYNDSPNIRNMFKKYNIMLVKTKYITPLWGVEKEDKKELVITNYDV